MTSPFPPGPPGGVPPFGATPPAATPPGYPGAPGVPAGWIPTQAGGAPPTPQAAPAQGKRNRALTALGAVLVLGGIGGAAAAFVLGQQRLSQTVEDLARSPADCVTTLDVATDGTYYLYVETKGEIGDLRGDCPGSGTSFEGSGRRDPTLTLADADGGSVRVRRASGVSYDVGGYSGELVGTARLDAGRYQLSVQSSGRDEVAVAVGGDVDDQKLQPVIPIAIGAGGVVLGLLALVLGRRKKRPAAPAGAAPAGVAPALGAPGIAWGSPPPPGSTS